MLRDSYIMGRDPIGEYRQSFDSRLGFPTLVTTNASVPCSRRTTLQRQRALSLPRVIPPVPASVMSPPVGPALSRIGAQIAKHDGSDVES